ncbi:MAG: monovalent cation/H+ antiporter subunit D family protein [Xanthomonadales bacterium]|nr:monovalent cation/H+ antiporter subunit D family protein [Xanthomonadales bacterium]
MSAQWHLLLCLLIPLAGGAGIVACRRWPNVREAVTLSTAVALFLSAISVLMDLKAGLTPRLMLAEPIPGVALALRAEPLGMMFALLASGLWIVTSVYAIGYMRAKREQNQTRFYLCFAIALSGAMGVALAENLFTLFVFYEMLTLSTYPLVSHAGDRNAVKGARTYLGILLATSIGLLLPAIVYTYSIAGTVSFTPGGILAGKAGQTEAALLLALFVLGVGKAAVMPVHRWLPAAMVAPTPVSALLHAVAVVKAGVFTITKVVIYIFGTDFLASIPAERLLVYLAGFTVISASVVALRQDNIKRLLAYSTISQLSYIVLAALVLTPFAEIGAAMHMVAHAFAKITLFFTAGAIYVAAGKTQVSQLDGIGLRMPLTMAAFTIGALSMVGVPPTAGFVSKWYMIAGAFQNDLYFVLAVLIISTALNAFYFLPIIHRAFFRTETVAPRIDHGEAPWPMTAALIFTAALTILFFVFNGPAVDFEKAIVQLP